MQGEEIEFYKNKKLDAAIESALGREPYMNEDGISWIDAPDYSTNMNAAMSLVESLDRRGISIFEMHYVRSRRVWYASIGLSHIPLGSGESQTPARAIAFAVLRALRKVESEMRVELWPRRQFTPDEFIQYIEAWNHKRNEPSL